MSSQWKTTTKATSWTIYITDQDGHTYRAGMIFADVPGYGPFTAYATGSDITGHTYPSKASAIRYLRNAKIQNLVALAAPLRRDLISAAMETLNNDTLVASCDIDLSSGAVDVTNWTDEDLTDDYFTHA